MAKRADGEGAIGKRKNGIFYGAVQIDGKRRWVYGQTRKEVVEKIKELQRQHEQGRDLDAGNITVKDFLHQWLEEVVKMRNKRRTYDGYRQIADSHIISSIGSVLLVSLRPDAVQKLLNRLAAQGMAPRTVRNVRAVLRRALNQAVNWRYVSFNAAVPVEIPRIEPYEAVPLTKEEARRLLDAVQGHRLEALYTMALLLGLREGELLGLLTADIDFAAGSVRVSGTLQWQGGKLVRETPKTRASTRTLPLPASLAPLLQRHIERQQTKFPECPYLFASLVGTPISPRNLFRQFKALLKKAGLRDIRFHDLRHSCATFLIAKGEHPRTVMELLGHSQISTTMNIYGHVLQENKVAAVAGVEAFLAEE